MSRKPTIKISYPEASDVAMKLTEAMVRRAPGRRVVETTSEDSASPAGGELFADFDACSTSTSVDLTLTLNSASMDYALETLIRPNLTADERKRILGDSAGGDDLLPGSAPAGASTCTEQSAAPRADDEPEKQIKIGKIPDKELRKILADLIVSMNEGTETETAIEDAINAMNYEAGVIGDTANPEQEYIEANELTDMIAVLVSFSQYAQNKKKCGQLCAFQERVYSHIQNLSEKTDMFEQYCIPVTCLWDSIVEADNNFSVARSRAPFDEFDILRKKAGYAPDLTYPVNTDKTETEQDGEIEAGLLNDMEGGEE